MIHGEETIYNDIYEWKYRNLTEVFGEHNHVLTHLIETEQQLFDAFEVINKDFNKMHFIEVKMGVLDAPNSLKEVSKAFAIQNK